MKLEMRTLKNIAAAAMTLAVVFGAASLKPVTANAAEASVSASIEEENSYISFQDEAYQNEFLRRVNNERVKAGLKPVQLGDSNHNSAAQEIPEGERDEALEEGVRIENRWGVTAIRAGQDGLTCTMQRCLAVFDHNGAFAPELDPLCTAERSADMVVLAIGQVTPPVGLCLFVACDIGKVSIEKVSREVLPYVGGLIVTAILLVLFPQIGTWLPSLTKMA